MPQTTQGLSRTSGGTYRTLKRTTEEWMKLFGRTDITLNTITVTQNANGRGSTTSTSSQTITGDLQYDPVLIKQYIDIGVALRGDAVLFVVGTVSIPLDTDSVSYEIVVDNDTWKLVQQIEGEVVDGRVPYKAFIARRRK